MPTSEIRRKKKALSATEESYFDTANQQAIKRMAARKQEEQPRLSPITGEPMVEEVISGVVIDRCPTSKGIWLDAGELEELIKAAMKVAEENRPTWFARFVLGVQEGE